MMINNKGGMILFLLILFMFSVNPIEANNDANDLIDEFWQELYVYSPLTKKLTFGLLFNDLYGVQAGNYDWFIEGGLKYKINKWLTTEVLYRQEYFKTGTVWTYENRPMLRISGSKTFGIWKVRNRQRFEMRFFKNDPFRFRYRTDVKVSPQWNFTSWNLNPYVQEELFMSEGRMSRIRSYLGIQGKEGRVEPSAYLLIQTKLNGRIARNNLIFGICFGIELN
ncbi:MAG: DUF2490 domain-containing protein [Marinilabiliaceae bacterium]|nr:DUF2490 domain-containing protein [Marinilabiliaceae bacterium]